MARPECLMGKAFTKAGDLYALGVMAYQLLIGDFAKPIAYGWERDVLEGELSRFAIEGDIETPTSTARHVYRETIGAAIEGNPISRIPSAGEFARVIRAIPAIIAEREAANRPRITELARTETDRRMRSMRTDPRADDLRVGGFGRIVRLQLLAMANADRAREDAEFERDSAQQAKALAESSHRSWQSTFGVSTN
ncbi:MAG: hypothetical protein QM811_23755 [Pirellulales bacterium]